MSAPAKDKLGRARKKLRKKLAEGFARVVFAEPGEAESRREEVHDGPEGPLADADFDPWFERAREAAARGLVKHTWVLDARTRLEIDARHGFLKQRELDASRVEKIMGGKDRALRPDRSADLLRAIGIMNADGSIPARRAKKYKQVNHLVELARPCLDHLAGRVAKAKRPLEVVDLACGNAYLSFVLAEQLRLEDRPAHFLGVELREDLVERCRRRAAELGFDHMDFRLARISEAELEAGAEAAPCDLLLALHACDTATDEALAWGLRREVPAMMVVPCCQAELARELGAGQAHEAGAAWGELPESLRAHGHLRRAFADLVTDALRVEALELCGYEVAVLEFVSTEHSAKNTLIRALRRPDAPAFAPARLDALADRVAAMGLDFALLRWLREDLGLSPAHERS